MTLKEKIEKALEEVEEAYNETDYNTKECINLKKCIDLLEDIIQG